jgi:hypothetical protein
VTQSEEPESEVSLIATADGSSQWRGVEATHRIAGTNHGGGKAVSVSQSSKPAFRERAKGELKELFFITAYLFVVLSALSFYKSAILEAEGVHWLPWGFALIKAVVLAKFIMIGGALYGGGGHRTKPLIWQIIHRSIAFLILVAGFTVIEEAIVGFIHDRTFRESMAEVGGGTTEEMIATAIIMFLIFLPLFAYRALGEVMGDKALFRALFVERLKFEVADRQQQPDRPEQ